MFLLLFLCFVLLLILRSLILFVCVMIKFLCHVSNSSFHFPPRNKGRFLFSDIPFQQRPSFLLPQDQSWYFLWVALQDILCYSQGTVSDYTVKLIGFSLSWSVAAQSVPHPRWHVKLGYLTVGRIDTTFRSGHKILTHLPFPLHRHWETMYQ